MVRDKFLAVRGRYAALLLLACLGGGYLLCGQQQTFLPYQPMAAQSFLVLNPEPTGNTLFDFVEARVEAGLLLSQADASIAAGDYQTAIDILQHSLQTFSYLDNIYERLQFAYTALDQWGLAREAMEASLMQKTTVRFHRWDASPRNHLPRVVDRTASMGLASCRHESGFEMDRVSPGVAVYDLDGNGYPEVICLGGPHRPTRVYRGGASGFSKASATGLEDTHHSQGVYVADLTHNGLPDVILTAIGSTRLYLNEGNLRFRPVPLPIPEIWASAVAAGDITGNGHVDLVIGGWLARDVWEGLAEVNPIRDDSATRESRHVPAANRPQHLLSVNPRWGVPLHVLEGDGAGGFVDITAASGVSVNATTLNLELVDVDGSGHLDLLVINDAMPSRLFLGNGQGHFRDVTHAARFADLRAGMGLAVADFFGNGEWDFVKTHFQGEMNGVFMHDGMRGGIPSYRDVALESGLGMPSLPYVSWAAFAWDFDADGQEDLLVLNGHFEGTPQPLQLFRNDQGNFSELSPALPAPLNEPLRARGAAQFDWNGNGHDDLLVAQNDGPVRLFEVQPAHDNHWLRVRVRLPDVDALGGVIEVVDSTGARQRRPVRTGSAYLSTQPRDYFFGLARGTPRTLEWKGRYSAFTCENLDVNRIVTLTEQGCEQSLPTAPR